ncbi:MAG TPA: trypsin-like peptidase domain-containing protein [Anaerolineae bacterium]|nr:trypsin-like peptidase domain-containing protein [Anaerolineae bacterium]
MSKFTWKQNPHWTMPILVVVFVIGLLGCSIVSASSQSNVPQIQNTQAASNVAPTQPPFVPLSSAAPLQPTGNLEQDVTAVSQRVSPAVVFVGIEANVRQFSEPIPIGNGSGAIIDTQGHILTNNHVVESAQALKVTLTDGRTFDATVVGRDPATDLAVIQIHGDNLPTIPLGDSNALQTGQFVVAIGNALGLEGGPTVTVGVVSALHRTIQEQNGASISDLIQTDAAINPGNSGGPLVNLSGELVGINTATPGTTSEGFQPSGIGFAIAVNQAKPVMQQLMANGRVVRPYLGIVPLTVTPAIQAQAGLSVNKGVILITVAGGSPAERAGLQEGDVVVAADGKAVTTDQELRDAIQAHKIGDTIQLTIIRNGRQSTVRAQLIESPPPG